MKKLIIGGIVLLLVLGSIVVWRGAVGNPVVRVRVVDPGGAPVAGAVVKPYALRGSSGGHYFWQGKWGGQYSAEPREVTTDAMGLAGIEYPTYLQEGIRSTEVTVTVEHPDYPILDTSVPVDSPLPTSAPMVARVAHLVHGMWKRTNVPLFKVGFKPGATILASGYLEGAPERPVKVYAQISTAREAVFRTDCWERRDGKLFTARMPLVPVFLQLVHRDAEGVYYFSEVQEFEPNAEGTNVVNLPLRRGISVKGRLDESVPRPVKNGWVSVRHVHGAGAAAGTVPLVWDDYTEIREDGRFEIAAIAPGRVEMIALSDGHISKNPPQTNPGVKIPQVFQLTNSAEVKLEMEATGTAAVKVLGPEGKPLAGASVHFWPNERWAEWSATIIGTGWHRTGELLDVGELERHQQHSKNVRVFEGKTDAQGLALVPELPARMNIFMVEHAEYELPLDDQGWRNASVAVMPGETNYATVKLQKKGTELME